MHDEILAQFPLPHVVDVRPVGTGLINATYRVTTADGAFALQKVHDVIPDAAAEDMRVVTTYLAEHGLRVPRLLMTHDGKPFARTADGVRWRMYPWIDGVVVDKVKSPEMARSAGALVGTMHRLLAALPYAPGGSIPHFHDTAFIVEELRRVRSEMPESVAMIADDVLARLPPLLATPAPRQLIHGDLKISNLLFDENDRAVGIIDFDTLLVHERMVDMGDALRSWCNQTAEDDPDARFAKDIFAAACAGYAEGFGADDDEATFLRGALRITLELTARFLIDVVRDSYFGFDSARYPTRRDANIARARGQHHLALTIPTP